MQSIHHPAHQRLVRRLKQARLNAGFTQVEVAKRLRRPQSFIASCESGQRRIDIIELAEFARVYRVTLQDLIEELLTDH